MLYIAKIFEGEKFQGFYLALKISYSKILVLQRLLLKLNSSLWFKLSLVIKYLKHILFVTCYSYRENFITKISFQRKNHSTLKFLTLENFRLYGITTIRQATG